jgi:hypothetical protein
MNAFDAGLTAAGRLFTITRIVCGIVLAGLTAWGVSFFVADYVSKAAVGGLTVAVENLQASITDLSATVREVSADIESFREGREALAIEIATRVGELKATDTGQAEQLKAIQGGIERIEASIQNIRSVTPIIYYDPAAGVPSAGEAAGATASTGVETVGGIDEAAEKLRQDPTGPVLIVPQ